MYSLLDHTQTQGNVQEIDRNNPKTTEVSNFNSIQYLKMKHIRTGKIAHCVWKVEKQCNQNSLFSVMPKKLENIVFQLTII